MEPLWSPVVATGGNQRQTRRAENGRNKRIPLPSVATGCLRRSMVSRASAVGCHPLGEVPSLRGRRSISLLRKTPSPCEPEGPQDLTANLAPRVARRRGSAVRAARLLGPIGLILEPKPSQDSTLNGARASLSRASGPCLLTPAPLG